MIGRGVREHPLANSISGAAIVMGTAPGCILEAEPWLGCATAFGVNRWPLLYPGTAAHWVTVHPEIFYPNTAGTLRHSDKPHDDVDHVWPIATRGGSSSLLATCIALEMGAEIVLLAGVHLEGEYTRFRDRWMQEAEYLRGRVFSLAPEGIWTRDFLGGPNEPRN